MNSHCNIESQWHRAVFAWMLFVVLLSQTSFTLAASKLADQRNVIFDRYTTEHGLSHAAITAIAQDNFGFMWVGTQEGLNRFDGYKFENFYHQDDVDGSIANHSINALHSDKTGNLWIGTDSGLNRLRNDRRSFEQIQLNQSKDVAVLSLFEASDGTMWIGTSTGLMSLSPEGKIVSYSSETSLSEKIDIRGFHEDSTGDLWIATEQLGLWRHSYKSSTLERVEEIKHQGLRDVIGDSSGNIWLASSSGQIVILDPKTNQQIIYDGNSNQSGLNTTRVRKLLQDKGGQIWAGTSTGLFLFDEANNSFIRYLHDDTDSHSLSDNNVLSLFQDVGGVVWVGTFNGLSKFNSATTSFPRFRTASTSGLESDAITSFASGDENDVWIGTFGGLHKWDAQSSTFTHLPAKIHGFSDDRVMSVDTQGEYLWIGTMTKGVNLLKSDELFAIMQHDPLDPNSISSNSISAFHVDSTQNVWIGTYGGGVNRYLGQGQFERFPSKNNTNGAFSSLRILDLVTDEEGTLWIATDGGGIIAMDPNTGETQTFIHKPDDTNSLSSNNTTALLHLEGVLWIGTRDTGLSRYDIKTNSFRSFSRRDGLASELVYGILADRDGNLWVSGGKGISVVSPISGDVDIYESIHGLQSDDFNSGAYHQLPDGTFLFGGNNGFNAFYPEETKSNEYTPPIRITLLSKFNKPVDLEAPIYTRQRIELDHSDSVFGLEFAAMDFTAPRKNRFRYRLEGFDRGWTDATEIHQVTYTNLDAGTYLFSLQGSNNDGVWNEAGTSLEIVVHPPLWATWWAYAIYLAVALFLIRQALEANQARLRREAEKRYSERLQLYIESLEEATDTVLIADANKNLLYANNSIGKILGLTPKQAEGRSIMSLLFTDPDDASEAREGIQSNGRWHGEVMGRRGSDKITTDVTITAVKDDNENETAFVSIARDITDRKKVEAELEAHRENLQSLVDERTTALKHEIAENKAVQRELANSLEEKELLLKEVHHRVKNNMQVISSLLNIQAETVNDDIFSGLLGESQQRIKSMSLIHENLYQSDNLLEIDFEDYINMLANSLHRFYRLPDIIVSLDIQVFNVALDIETAVPCGLIINELISNAFKHAFNGRTGKGCITIVFRQTDTDFILCISDDGNGLPEGFSLDTQSSMGTEIVVILTHQLDGKISFCSENGARFEITFPKKEKIEQLVAEA